MCTRIVVVDVLAAAVAQWDPDDVAIYVRSGVDGEAALREVCAILADLDAPPLSTPGAPLCWCGSAVLLPAELAAAALRRRTHSSEQVGQVSRGA
jgi:hypothetical protein